MDSSDSLGTWCQPSAFSHCCIMTNISSIRIWTMPKNREGCSFHWSLCASLSTFRSNHLYVLIEFSLFLIFDSFLQLSCLPSLRIMEISLRGFGGLVWIVNLSLLYLGACIFWLPHWILVFLPKIYDDNFKDIYNINVIIHLADYL